MAYNRSISSTHVELVRPDALTPGHRPTPIRQDLKRGYAAGKRKLVRRRSNCNGSYADAGARKGATILRYMSLIVVGSVAVAVPLTPPPETAAEFVSADGAPAATFTVNVIAG